MKNLRNVLFVSVLLFAFLAATSAVWAYPLPPSNPLISPPCWWKVPGDPLGMYGQYTRTQFHSFITDPREALPPGSPDYTFNGFTPSQTDSWIFGWAPPEGFGTVGPTGPNPGDDGIGLPVPYEHDMTKTMGNMEILYFDKLFFVAVDWYDAEPDTTLTINCVAEAGTHQVINPQLTTVKYAGNYLGWRTTYLTGSIHPQPNYEDFHFLFENGEVEEGSAFVDSLWVGTKCPEPSTIAMMLFGGLGVIGGVIRKFRR